MGTEIERKFLLRDAGWKIPGNGVLCRQGYLCADPERTVRVRVMGDKGFLTVKGKTTGATRAEFEYEIPALDAETMLNGLAKETCIEKLRYRIPYGGMVWEVDEFLGANAGLVVAELELESEEQPFVKPDWVGEEVTGDARYYNANLAENPFKAWRSGEICE